MESICQGISIAIDQMINLLVKNIKYASCRAQNSFIFFLMKSICQGISIAEWMLYQCITYKLVFSDQLQSASADLDKNVFFSGAQGSSHC